MITRMYCFVIYSALFLACSALITSEEEAQRWFEEFESREGPILYDYFVATWNFNTNITKYNQDVQGEKLLLSAEFDFEGYTNANMFDWKNFKNETLKRIFRRVTDIGYAALNDSVRLAKYGEISSSMASIYSSGKVCKPDGGKCYDLEPGLETLMADSRDPDELLWAWKGWRDAVGPPIRPYYEKRVEFSNEAARKMGYSDTGEEWRQPYETESFVEDMETLFNQIKPFYENLHAYVRYRLIQRYGEKLFPESGHIPAHLLGNMWAEEWNNIFDIITPFPDAQAVDVTNEMVSQNYTALKMFQLSDEFFISLGLEPMPNEFWSKSMLEKPTDGRKVVCHESAWDFYNQVDYRIKKCTYVNTEDLFTVHHEMGHIQYYLQYKNLPIIFRSGANPGFHEAVGDVIALSVSNPLHLKKVGLLKTVNNDTEADLNYMFSQALYKIAFIPFGYLMDLWRWDVFNGKTEPSHYNANWWKLRCKYQGISPPVPRSDEADFDPGAKFHISENAPFIRYFVSYVVQFQFHKALCDKSGYSGPLHKCDIFQSKEAGKALGDMLRLGASVPWQDAMESLTGKRVIDAQPLLDYFQPINEFLISEQQRLGYKRTWNDQCSNSSQLKLTFTVLFVLLLSGTCLRHAICQTI